MKQRKYKNTRLLFRSFFLALTLLTACKQVPVPAPEKGYIPDPSAPDWYAHQSINVPGYRVGYGDAVTLEQAKAIARVDLAASFKAKVSGSIRIDKTLTHDSLEQRAKSRIEQFTSANFEDLQTLKSEQQAGRYYLVLGFDHRPLHQRLISKIKNVTIQAAHKQQLPVTSRLYQQLEQELGRVPTMQLYHERGRYLLALGGTSETVRDDEIELIVPRADSPDIDLALNPVRAVYPPETLFTVEIQAHKAGFLNYLQVFGNGATVLMLANHAVDSSTHVNYPDRDLYDGLVTELPESATSTWVQHLAVICPDVRDLNRFEDVSNRANERYDSFFLGEWNRLFDGCRGQSQQQKIRR